MLHIRGTPAVEALNEARARLRYRSPCQSEAPGSWDAPDSGIETASVAALRVQRAIDGCRSCLVFDLCYAVLLEEGDDAWGVMAGTLNYDKVTKKEYRERVEKFLKEGRDKDA